MKKILVFGIMAIMVLFLIGCSSNAIIEQKNESKVQIKLNAPTNQQPQFSMVTSTEYMANRDTIGSTIAKLLDWTGSKINTTCYITILYPDKTTYLDWTRMTQHWEFGNYYMNYSLPNIEGNYDQELRCWYNGKNLSLGKAFHISTDKINETLSEMIIGESYG